MQVFFSALIDVAGHAKMLDEAFGILQDAKSQGIRLGTISYSSLMGACCNVCAFYCCSRSFYYYLQVLSFLRQIIRIRGGLRRNRTLVNM